MYINGASCISIQNTLNFNKFCDEIIEYEDCMLQAVNPNYKEYFSATESRRMNKTIKNTLIASQKALSEADVKMPDAIITGTGLGVLSDTFKFLDKMVENDEQFLTPTSFIQSTHNTPAGQIANRIKCHNYNMTYANRANSFESAMTDAYMHLKEGKKDILIGTTEEMIPSFFKLQQKVGVWKKEPVKNTELFNSKTKGSIAGEGFTFFVLSSNKSDNYYAKIKDFKTLYKPSCDEDIKNEISTLLEKNNLGYKDIDAVILGNSGDVENDKIYHKLSNSIFENNQQLAFKHLSGEYETSASFAVWLAANIIKYQKVPQSTVINSQQSKSHKNILIFNNYQNINHSFIIISQ